MSLGLALPLSLVAGHVPEVTWVEPTGQGTLGPLCSHQGFTEVLPSWLDPSKGLILMSWIPCLHPGWLQDHNPGWLQDHGPRKTHVYQQQILSPTEALK